MLEIRWNMYAFTFTAHKNKFLLPQMVFDPKNLSQNLRAETTTTSTNFVHTRRHQHQHQQHHHHHGGNKKHSNSPPSTRRKEVTAEDIRGTLNFDKFGAHDRETSLNSSTIEESLRLSRKYEREKLGENVTPHHHHRKEISVSLAAAAEETFY